MTCYLNCETYANDFEPHGSGPLHAITQDCYSTRTRSFKHFICHSRVSPGNSKNGTAVNAVARLACGRDPAVTGPEAASCWHVEAGPQHYFYLICSATVGPVVVAAPCLGLLPSPSGMIECRFWAAIHCGLTLVCGCELRHKFAPLAPPT